MSGSSRALVLISVVALFVLRCGADSVQAQRFGLEAVQLRFFPRQNWRLPNNKFFLWKEDMTPDQVSRARVLSKELDDLDSQAVPLNRRYLELESKIDPIKDSIRLLTTHQRTVKTSLDKATKAKGTAEKDLATAQQMLADEQAKPNPDPAVIAQCNADILRLGTQITDLTAQMADLQSIKDKLDQNISQLKTTLQPLQDEKDSVSAQQDTIRMAGQARVDEIMTLVEWYKDQPYSVVFQFEPDGTLSASISGWNLGDGKGPRNFSTEATTGHLPTMGRVTYDEMGGVFEFEVYAYDDDAQTQLGAIYSFRIGRVKYDSLDGLNYFGGDIIRKIPGSSEVRRGIAKMVDRNN